MATPAYQSREDPGGRRVATGEIKGQRVEIAYGWDIAVDRWRYHVYVHDKKAGKMMKVPVAQPLADSEHQAIDEGFRVAEGVIG